MILSAEDNFDPSHPVLDSSVGSKLVNVEFWVISTVAKFLYLRLKKNRAYDKAQM